MNQTIAKSRPEDLKFKDLELFLSLSQTLNIRELSRKTSLTPSQISKAIHKIETALGTKLFNRSTTGLSLSNDGKITLPKIKKLYVNFLELSGTTTSINKNKLTIASSSFFVSHLLPKVASSFKEQHFSIIEIPPEDFIQVGLRAGFSVCIHTSKLDWPKTWHSEEVGEAHYNLYANKNHELCKKKRVLKSDLEKASFITPIYWTREGLKNGNDQFPKSIKRTIAHKTATALSAAGIISSSDNVGFLPSLVTEHLPNLKEIKTSLIPPVTQKVYITVKSDEVSQIFYSDLIKKISKALK